MRSPTEEMQRVNKWSSDSGCSPCPILRDVDICFNPKFVNYQSPHSAGMVLAHNSYGMPPCNGVRSDANVCRLLHRFCREISGENRINEIA
jgi:hypothetical protein